MSRLLLFLAIGGAPTAEIDVFRNPRVGLHQRLVYALCGAPAAPQPVRLPLIVHRQPVRTCSWSLPRAVSMPVVHGFL